MVFSSIVFILYFLPALLLAYYLVKYKYKNLVLLLFSIFFYAWGAPKFIFVILATTFIDFHLVKWMDSQSSAWKRKLMLTLSVSINLGLLIYFKYANFFIQNLNHLEVAIGGRQINLLQVVMPIGISFYTFETITYVVDVYRRIHKPLIKFWDYQLYIILFPKLIAGPIVRYHELADQISDRRSLINLDNTLTGFYRFVIGLSKKVLIANVLGEQADLIFNSSTPLHSITAWTGILCYTFQIYFDFSGYSDMALGLAKMLGFILPENFNNPYISKSITEFWRRWHITLGKWMKNYLYIPLGGNQVNSQRRLYFNLWIVFLASGLWHGASWNFIIWGIFHGTIMVIERWKKVKIPAFPKQLFTFLLVMIGWVFFRLETTTQALHFIRSMFSFSSGTQMIYIKSSVITMLVIAAVFAFFCNIPGGENIQGKIFHERYTIRRHIIISSASILLLFLCVSMITSSGFNPFIYFRF